MNRSAGILLSVTSLPSRYGIGCLDSVAFRFVDCLAEAGQTYWQILPLGPTGFGESGDSPYQSFSAFTFFRAQLLRHLYLGPQEGAPNIRNSKKNINLFIPLALLFLSKV